MRLIQFITLEGMRQVGLVDVGGSDTIRVLQNTVRVYDLALAAHRTGRGLAELVAERLGAETVAYDQLINEKRLLPPLDHSDPAHCFVTGTGLTHLGSGQARHAMHAKLATETETLTDSLKMFKLGLEGGKPQAGQIGVSPEWFYKGDGACIVPPGQPLELPAFALDGGEEAEIVGLYVISDEGTPLRVGFAMGNEYADHVLERQNYLYLAHSKLRQCSIGPELVLGPLPEQLTLAVSVQRGEQVLWHGEVLTGEANMSHSLANMEHHHFKYNLFRRPGDVHCHFFGTAALSFAAGIKVEPGDEFEIAAEEFGRPLRNPLKVGQIEGLVTVQPL